MTAVRGMKLVGGMCTLLYLEGCPPSSTDQAQRAEPQCATLDCKTGKVVDNGCTPDGRCKSCVNTCDPPIEIRE